MAKLAFMTFGVLQESIGHPAVQGFVTRAPGVLDAAESSAGFIDRYYGKEETGARPWDEYVSPAFFDADKHGAPAITLSYWTDLESVFAFAYNGIHLAALQRGHRWMIKVDWPPYVAWWVEDGHTSTQREAVERHLHIHEKGPTPTAFDFKCPFDASGKSVSLDQQRIKALIEVNAGAGG